MPIFDAQDYEEMERAVSDCCGIGSLVNDYHWDDGDGESGPSLQTNPSHVSQLQWRLDVAAWIGTPDFRAKAGLYFGCRPSGAFYDTESWCYFHDERDELAPVDATE